MMENNSRATPPDTYGFTQHLLSLLRHLEKTRPDKVQILLAELVGYSTGFCTSLPDFKGHEWLSLMQSSAGLSDGGPVQSATLTAGYAQAVVAGAKYLSSKNMETT